MGRRREMEVDKILHRLDSLISLGENVLAAPVSDRYFVDSSLVQQWRTSSLAFLNVIFGSDSIHYHQFEERCKGYARHDATVGLATLKSAREDIEGGYLQKVENLVSAEIFNDFLEMAEHLLDNEYKDPAAFLVGAVLEDGLRRLCGNNDLTVKSGDNISSLNKKLADSEAHNRLKQRDIEVWNKLRDYADHGRFEQYKVDDVSDMLKGVRSFLSDNLK